MRGLARLLVGVALLSTIPSLLVGCASDGKGSAPVEVEPSATAAHPAASTPDLVAADDALYAFRLRWRPESDAALSTRVTTLAQVLSSSLNNLDGELHDAFEKQRGRPRIAWELGAAVGSPIAFSYVRAQDDLRVSLKARGSLDDVDVGEVDARTRFGEVVAALGRSGTLNVASYDIEHAQVSPTIEGHGAEGVEFESGTTEYGFTALRRIRGIPLENAGVSVRISRAGRVDRIRVGGVQVESKGSGATELPLDGIAPLVRAVSEAELAQRFRTEYPDATASRAGIAYAIRDDVPEAVVAPRYVVHYSSRSTLSGGVVSVSRQRVIAYSLTDRTAPPEDLSPRPNPQSAGDPR